jgi:hypothetical protein
MKVIKNKIYILITIFFLFLFKTVDIFATDNTCKYTSQIEQCMQAQNWWEKAIEDFVCVNWNRAKVAYQVILDMEFKEIDDKMDKYLENLEKNKNIYFWIWAKKNYIDWINDIWDMWDMFRTKYLWLCTDIILKEAINCSDETSIFNKSVPIENAKDYFHNQWSTCRTLVDKKISIFNDVAFWVLMLNKLQIKADEKKTYDQWQRTNYDHLLDIMMINIWYIERIWQKWPSKLANPMQ